MHWLLVANARGRYPNRPVLFDYWSDVNPRDSLMPSEKAPCFSYNSMQSFVINTALFL